MIELKLYNTRTRNKDAFKPYDVDNVRLYVCGPTVYDYAHIGNARPVIVFDVLFRLLRHIYGEAHVTYVRNITDVDDKINARATRDYPHLPLNAAIKQVSEQTTRQFHEDVAALGCLPPSIEPRATDYIAGMVKMNQTLLDKNHAYIAQGSEGYEVLFAVQSMPSYGQLSHRKTEDQQAGARVEIADHKHHAGDFVLWKQSGNDAPGWDGAFIYQGQKISIYGRPGWHIECSVMSAHHLGERFDIHGGGLDLIFPHHENEIAQSCCAHGNDVMANVWMHNGYLQLEGRKMSKSEGNFITIHDLLHTQKFGGRSWRGDVLRLGMLMTHYREPIDFTVKRLEEAEHLLSKWHKTANFDGSLPPESFLEALYDDLNLYKALSMIAGFKPSHQGACLGLLGFQAHQKVMISSVCEHEIAQAIEQRLQALEQKNWAEADKIRDDLAAQGISLQDYKDPETGARKTKWSASSS